MPVVNVYRNVGGDTEYVETISLAERDKRVASMTSADPAGMPYPYAYRDAHGVVWGFAPAATAEELAARLPERAITPAEEAQHAAEIAKLFAPFRGA